MVAQMHQDNLSRIKKNVEVSYKYFEDNYDSFNKFKKFVFVTSLTKEDEDILRDLKKPQLEFNVLEAYISRLRGEFSKSAPEIEVSSDKINPVGPEVVDLVENHIRYMEEDFRKDGSAYQIYTDQLSGGFSVIKIWTEYANAKTFDQQIKIGRVFDPTLCGFDPMSELAHKGDGQYCYELYPMRKDEFEVEFPNIDVSKIKFKRNIKSFSWSYSNMNDDVMLVCSYYEKKKRKIKIVKLSNNTVMTSDEYEEFKEKWEESGSIEQIPQIIKERSTSIDEIVRYQLIEDQVISHKVTNYKYLPLVFVDGNSVKYRDSQQSDMKQKTRPYFYHARDAQRLKNFAGQTLANELENMVQHKFMVPKEGIPKGYEDAYTDVQVPNIMIYNATHPDDPTQHLPPPSVIPRVPAPPEVTNTFQLSDQLTQTILGSYDAALGINDNQLSGIAVIEAATQSNAAAMPYIVSYIKALNQVASIILDLIPKYYVTSRSIPVLDKKGKKDFVIINQDGQNNIDYEENALNIKVEAGVNFSVQKSRALKQIAALMQASPMFAQFMNQKGLPILLDNMEIRGIDQLKKGAEEFIQEMQEQMQQQKQMQSQESQQNPIMIKLRQDQIKMQQDVQQNQVENKLKGAQIAVDKESVDNDRLKIMTQMKGEHDKNLVQVEKSQTEQSRMAVDMALKGIDMRHRHEKDTRDVVSKNIENNYQQ